MKTGFKVAALGLLVAMAAPAHAVTITSVEIKNSQPNFLQIAELQLFQAMTGTNVALTGIASGSSYSSVFFGNNQDAPAKAIDGSTDGDYYAGGISHSLTASGSEVFALLLAQAYDVTLLTIFGRTDCCSERDQYTYTLYNGANVVGTGALDARGGVPASATFASSVSAVPEPSTWAMMLLGFGVVGSALRSSRRRQKLTVRYS